MLSFTAFRNDVMSRESASTPPPVPTRSGSVRYTSVSNFTDWTGSVSDCLLLNVKMLKKSKTK